MFESTAGKTLPKKLSYAPINGDWYDEDYLSGKKSNWESPYCWENFENIFKSWAKIVVNGFPEAKSFLDVGCATGMLERAILELAKRKHLRYEIHGFDHSPTMILNCEEVARPFIEQSSIDDFTFTQNYDVMISFDVFEHLTEEQAMRFLQRSRYFINDCMFFVIALDEPKQRNEPSHINLKTREYWHEVFLKCGWVQTPEFKLMQDIAMREDNIRRMEVEIFIYGANNV
jgi:2-polyprenyl-3-methyl-5-hydroxy-6-metoxy-1,4-benzoquinol methylase